MKSGKSSKNKNDYRIILTKPETIFNNEVARIVARNQEPPCTTVRKVLKGLLAVRADLLEDRPGLFGLLMDAWRHAAANVGGLADMIMETPGGIVTDDKYVNSVIAPYAVMNNFLPPHNPLRPKPRMQRTEEEVKSGELRVERGFGAVRISPHHVLNVQRPLKKESVHCYPMTEMP